jgi:hypothetical protein
VVLAREGFGKLYNTEHELVAEGHCQVDDDRGTITMRPVMDTPTLSRQRGRMRLELEDGSEIYVTDNVIRFRLNVPGFPGGAAYRMSFADKPPLSNAGGLL